MQLVNIAVVVD